MSVAVMQDLVVHRKETQSLISSGTAVCAVKAKYMTVAQAGACSKTKLAVMWLSSTMVRGRESILALRAATVVQFCTYQYIQH